MLAGDLGLETGAFTVFALVIPDAVEGVDDNPIEGMFVSHKQA
jgi:hypothetical protein